MCIRDSKRAFLHKAQDAAGLLRRKALMKQEGARFIQHEGAAVAHHWAAQPVLPKDCGYARGAASGNNDKRDALPLNRLDGRPV